METVYFVKITSVFSGVEFIEYVGLHQMKTLSMVGGHAKKMKRIHGWKTLKSAEKYIESAKRMDELMGQNRKFEIVHS